MLSLENCHSEEFYSRQTTKVARDLLGSILCRRLPSGEILSAKIVETEAYRDNEPACHAARGPTPRCAVMFGPPGISYVYFIYGTNHCLNVVTEPVGNGCAVLIRALEGENTNGPGKLCKMLGITRDHNGISLLAPESQLWIAQGEQVRTANVGTSSRIGVTAAHELQWRYFIKGHPDVSGPKWLNGITPKRKIVV